MDAAAQSQRVGALLRHTSSDPQRPSNPSPPSPASPTASRPENTVELGSCHCPQGLPEPAPPPVGFTLRSPDLFIPSVSPSDHRQVVLSIRRLPVNHARAEAHPRDRQRSQSSPVLRHLQAPASPAPKHVRPEPEPEPASVAHASPLALLPLESSRAPSLNLTTSAHH